MHSARKLTLLTIVLALLLAMGISPEVQAVDSASISFLDSSDQPQFGVTGTNPVDDDGCDIVTVLMSDATGGIVDVDTLCLDLTTGSGGDFTDWGSHQSGYVPTQGPITYTLYDTGLGDICDTDENSSACSDYLSSGAVPCITEAYYQPPSLPAGAALKICFGPGGCDVNMPLTTSSVVGAFVANAPLYWAPGQLTDPVVTLPAGKTAWVLGQDESGQYYKIVWVCDLVWVPTSTIGPNYDATWQGRPLPTNVVK